MNKNLKIILKCLGMIFVVFIFVSIITLYVYTFYTIKGYTEYGVDYAIGDHIGFNLDEDAIHFGTVIPGMKATRKINISSYKAAWIDIYIEDLEHVDIDEHSFFLDAGGSKEVKLSVMPVVGAEEGNHSGKMRVIYKRP